jgi:type II secretory pathway predicted ATPase ExeA
MRRKTLDTFGLSHDPFTKEIGDDALWAPPSKKEVIDSIVEALEARHHVLLIGEPGAGKTAVLRAVRHGLPQTRYRLTYCHNATLGRRDFYRQLCTAIGLSPKATAAAVFNALNDYVLELAAEQQQHPVFILDECHLMRDEMLDHLHILQNYAWDSQAILTLLLVGLPELRERLQRRRHRSLMSRIQRRFVVEPLEPDDTAAYLRYRLSLADCDTELYPSDAVAVLHEKTGGLMRDLDRIAALALDVAAKRRAKLVHKDTVLAAISVDLNGGLV